jgi:hypothetical protein
MTSKNIHIISDSYTLEKNKELSDINIYNILVKDETVLSKEISKLKNHSDLIILVNLNNLILNDIIKALDNLNIPIIFCSEESFEKINKINKIASITPYVIHGFKNETNNVLYEAIKKIIN